MIPCESVWPLPTPTVELMCNYRGTLGRFPGISRDSEWLEIIMGGPLLTYHRSATSPGGADCERSSYMGDSVPSGIFGAGSVLILHGMMALGWEDIESSSPNITCNWHRLGRKWSSQGEGL